MERDIKILVDGKQADYQEVRGLPLSLARSADQPIKIVGTGEDGSDNSASRLTLAASKGTLEIYGNAHIPTVDSTPNQGTKPVSLLVGGKRVFQGFSRLEGFEYERGEPVGVSLELFGQAESFFGRLGTLNLRTLEMGDFPYTPQYIEESWDGSYDNGDSVVLAPVVYKAPTMDGGRELYVHDHFRPSVYFRSIVDSILDNLGYSLNSTFMETAYFKQFVYLFGVGDRWRKSTPLIEANSTFTNTPVEPPLGNFNWWELTFFSLSVPADDTYNISLSVGQRLACDVRIVDTNGTVIGTMPLGIQNAEPLELENVPLTQGTSLRLELMRLSAGVGASSLAGPISLTINSTIAPEIGSSIDIASCLHGKYASQFFAGLQHMFNLAFYVNEEAKEVTIEPRFEYELDGVKYPGYYLPDAEAEDWTSDLDDEAFDREFDREHGNHFILKPIIEDSNLSDLAQRLKGESDLYCGVKFNMVDADEPGKVVENPYFENLLLYRSAISDFDWMPVVSTDWDADDGLPEDADFKSEPKYAFYAGNIDWRAWLYHTPGNILTQRPVLFQRPPENAQSYFQYNGHIGAYSDYERPFGTSILPGFGSIFYPRLAKIKRKGELLTCRIKRSPDQFYEENFRRPKKLRIQGADALYILLKMSQYEPLGVGTCEAVFLKLETLLGVDSATIEHDNVGHEAKVF